MLTMLGWNAPRRSLELVQPSEQASKASNKEMHISFDPSPDYGGIAKAAAGTRFGSLDGGLLAKKASTVRELGDVLKVAVKSVSEGRGAVVEVVLNVDEMGESR